MVGYLCATVTRLRYSSSIHLPGRKLINLPICETSNESAVFTSAPTSDDCLVFGLANIKNDYTLVAINTLKVGESNWKTTRFVSPEDFFTYQQNYLFI